MICARVTRSSSSASWASIWPWRSLAASYSAFSEISPCERASAIELALEGLYLARRIGKESGQGETIYG